MRAEQMKQGTGLKPQKLSLFETPHLTIEPNYTCNTRCEACYNVHHDWVKPLSQVKGEIDIGLRKRNLESISLVGGEPTIHPDIVEIIRYVKKRGLTCILVTNGSRFLDGDGESFVDRLIAAGVDRVALHVDTGQGHADIEQTRRAMFSILEQRRVFFGLSVTIYAGDEGELPKLMKRYTGYRYFDGVLATLARDLSSIENPGAARFAGPAFLDVYRGISEHLGVEPATYLPSSVDDDEVCWLIYLYYVNPDSHRTFALSPRLSRLLRRLYRGVNGRNAFAPVPKPGWLWFNFAISCLAEIVVNPRKLGAALRLFGGGLPRFQYIIVQRAPEQRPVRGQKPRLQICYHCPDATIRHGKLTPVCIADQLAPIGAERAGSASERMVRAVYEHLGEM